VPLLDLAVELLLLPFHLRFVLHAVLLPLRTSVA
jgi:hypothetical protein